MARRYHVAEMRRPIARMKYQFRRPVYSTDEEAGAFEVRDVWRARNPHLAYEVIEEWTTTDRSGNITKTRRVLERPRAGSTVAS